jgi:MIP family channel proteins
VGKAEYRRQEAGMTTVRVFVAEFIGTFFLCFIGIAAILSGTAAVGAHPTIVGIALAHGLALTVGVAVFGGVSGGHLNPAVTAGLFATGRIKLPDAITHVIAQLAGGTGGALICKCVFPVAAIAEANLGIPLPAAWASPGVVFTMEFVLTFLLMIAVFGIAVDERGKAVKIGAFAIGLTVTFDILAGGAVSGASMNPARSFGPALVQGFWDFHYLYWIGPVAGAVVAALLYEHVILEKKQ